MKSSQALQGAYVWGLWQVGLAFFLILFLSLILIFVFFGYSVIKSTRVYRCYQWRDSYKKPASTYLTSKEGAGFFHLIPTLLMFLSTSILFSSRRNWVRSVVLQLNLNPMPMRVSTKLMQWQGGDFISNAKPSWSTLIEKGFICQKLMISKKYFKLVAYCN